MRKKLHQMSKVFYTLRIYHWCVPPVDKVHNHNFAGAIFVICQEPQVFPFCSTLSRHATGL